MSYRWWEKRSAAVQSSLAAVFVVSFLAGSIGGAVFGILTASFATGQLSRALTAPSGLVSSLRGQTPPSAPAGQTLSVTEVVRRSAPAVVSIVITKDVPKLQSVSPFFFGGNPFGNDFFNNFFPQLQPQPQPQQPRGTQKQEVGGGTGFFVSADGYIVTNKHVVADTEAEYTVLLNSGKRYPAKVVSLDPANDVAVVKITGTGFPTIPLGDSSTLQLGDSVVAIGNALGEFRNTVSTGVVSGLARSVTAGGSILGTEQLSGVIQTDAAINPGNSGGPLLNLKGEVIGINTAVAQGAQNIGFAIPVNEIKQAIDSVKRTGRIVRPFLGVRYVVITEDLAKAKQLPVTYGALVVRGETPTDLAVTPGSPADKAGIVENDIILEVKGQKVDAEHQLSTLVSGHSVGDAIPLKIFHRGDTKVVNVTLTERK